MDSLLPVASSLGKSAGDISFLLVFILLSLGVGFLFGRWKLINILINIYIALAFVGVLASGFLDFSVYGKLIAFFVIVLFLTAIDTRLFDVHIASAGTDFFWRLFVMSVLVTGFFVSTVFSLLPRQMALSYIPTSVYGFFATPIAELVWMAVPLLVLLFINNRLK
ncbi:MAG: hypothetical protein WAU88_07310 [Candidatus Zixiibacteriota bacterium]